MGSELKSLGSWSKKSKKPLKVISMHARDSQEGMRSSSYLQASVFLTCWYIKTFDFKQNSVFLTCVDEHSIHIDFGTEGAQDKSTGWSKYQHCKQDPYKEREKRKLVLGSRCSGLLQGGMVLLGYQIDRYVCVSNASEKRHPNCFSFLHRLSGKKQRISCDNAEGFLLAGKTAWIYTVLVGSYWPARGTHREIFTFVTSS